MRCERGITVCNAQLGEAYTKRAERLEGEMYRVHTNERSDKASGARRL